MGQLSVTRYHPPLLHNIPHLLLQLIPEEITGLYLRRNSPGQALCLPITRGRRSGWHPIKAAER
jgi:hypothetical protein